MDNLEARKTNEVYIHLGFIPQMELVRNKPNQRNGKKKHLINTYYQQQSNPILNGSNTDIRTNLYG